MSGSIPDFLFENFFKNIKPSASLMRLVIKEVEKLERRSGRDLRFRICLGVIMILAAAVLHLLYQNFLAEQMLKELNREYEDVVQELEEAK